MQGGEDAESVGARFRFATRVCGSALSAVVLALEKVGQIVPIRNAFGVNTEGVSADSNRPAVPIRNGRAPNRGIEFAENGARLAETQAASYMHPPGAGERSARLTLA
jgi:hypothetical protein